LIIEFCGLPGVGKTTISRKIADRLESMGLRVQQPTFLINNMMSKWERLLYKIQFAVQGPDRNILGLFSKTFSANQYNAKKLLRLCLNYHYIRGLQNKGMKGQISIFDQGLVQSLWSIVYEETKNQSTDITAFLPFLEWKNDEIVVINLETDDNILSSRIGDRKRDQSRLRHDLETKKVIDLKFLKKSMSELLSFVNEAKTLTRVSVLNIRNDTSPEQCASDITAIIIDNVDQNHYDDKFSIVV
jgi:adenylate kinase